MALERPQRLLIKKGGYLIPPARKAQRNSMYARSRHSSPGNQNKLEGDDLVESHLEMRSLQMRAAMRHIDTVGTSFRKYLHPRYL